MCFRFPPVFRSDLTLNVQSPHVRYTEDEIISDYEYQRNHVDTWGKTVNIIPQRHRYVFRTQRKVPKTGMLLFLRLLCCPALWFCL